MKTRRGPFTAGLAPILTLAAGLSLGMSLGASAQPAFGSYGRADGFGPMFSALQLSEAQKQQIHQIMQTARAQNQPQMTQMRSLQQQMRSTLFSTGDVTAATLAPIEQQIESLRQQLDANRLQTALQIRSVLTTTQLARAASLQSQLSSLHQQERTLLGAPAQ